VFRNSIGVLFILAPAGL